MADPCGSRGSNSHGKLWWLRLRPFVSAISGWIWLVHRSDPSIGPAWIILDHTHPKEPVLKRCTFEYLINQDLVSANVGLLCLLSLFSDRNHRPGLPHGTCGNLMKSIIFLKVMQLIFFNYATLHCTLYTSAALQPKMFCND